MRFEPPEAKNRWDSTLITINNFGDPLPFEDIENALIGILRKNAYMFMYFGWLLHRWYPLYSKYDDHLPRKYTD